MGHHKKKKKHKSKHKRRSSSSSDSPVEPSKKQKIIGPCLPTVLPTSTVPAPAAASTSAPAAASTSTHSDSYGPQLPPHLSGPQLPPHLSKPKQTDLETQHSQPVQEDDDDVGNIIGPLPTNLQGSSSAQQALDERAEILKYEFLLKGTGDDDITQRETWMTELPPEKANYCGLGARKFRATTNYGDPKNRHLWTETPLDKNKSQEQQESVDETNTFEELIVEQRNKLMDQMVKKNEGKKEKKSLLEIHREKLKKNKHNTKDGKQERRPFDRDVDLEVNKFDDAQKKSMLKRAQLLDSKFAHGKSKYL